ncbi:MAG: ATP-binding protein [Acidimicrobiia bacterium]|nr:ATP-binding protein [Acidimicrobiia bacterium]
MDFFDVTDMVAGGKSEHVEFKATTGERKEAARTLSAMLNGRGGSVLFGVSPKEQIVGQQVATGHCWTSPGSARIPFTRPIHLP